MMNAVEKRHEDSVSQQQDIELHSPFTLGNGVELKNRLVKSAMSEQLGSIDHDPVDGLVTLYKAWARGGAGLNITGNIMVDRSALGEPGNVVLDKDSDLGAFARWTDAGTRNDTHLWAQLNHPGKQSPKFLNPAPVAPSAIALEGALEKQFGQPRALTEAEISQIIEKFANSARLAKQVGFTGVQIHGAHGYLISQFLSPRHNQRQDKWGGSVENRMRFVREVYRSIRAEVGCEFPVGIKLNSADFMRGGFSEEDSMQVITALAADGLDLIEISGGSYEKPSFIEGNTQKHSTVKREAFFIDYAERVRKETRVPLMVTGGFRSGQGMREALNSGATDLIGLGRALAVNPEFPRDLIDNPQRSIQLPRRSTGIARLDSMSMIDVQWYQQQIMRLAKGKLANPKMSEWSALMRMFLSVGLRAFSRARAS